jgi:hypothetical protein
VVALPHDFGMTGRWVDGEGRRERAKGEAAEKETRSRSCAARVDAGGIGEGCIDEGREG